MQLLWETTAHEPIQGGFDGLWRASGKSVEVNSPIDGAVIGEVVTATSKDCDRILAAADEAYQSWRLVPAPKRAEVVRQLGEALREQKEELAQLLTLEMGKPIVESRGEVQEMIDVCDFAVGLGRQIGGLTLPSERAGHRLVEKWHPLGVVGVITAFNFPVAVWAWNAALGLVCGNTLVWKPSSKTPLAAIAATRIAQEVLERNGHPGAIAGLVVGAGRDVGDRLIRDTRVKLVSYTGSVPTGRHVGTTVQERFGRSILELGGNAAAIVTPSADLEMAAQAIYFGAVGTAGQRCTTTRRLIVHEDIHDQVIDRLKQLYAWTPMGDPRNTSNVMGPLVDDRAVQDMRRALAEADAQGAELLCGGELKGELGTAYVTPAMVAAKNSMPIVQQETFAPILYVMKYSSLEEAVALQNGVPQGLASAIFTNDMREAEQFTSEVGSDCGLANVNAGTVGAEIGGAFGGEKETGGGRESGSDSWKGYMRRQTTVVNYSGGVELAQGVTLDIDDR
jgi:aldehyde dehydrogenase (NAD+)